MKNSKIVPQIGLEPPRDYPVHLDGRIYQFHHCGLRSGHVVVKMFQRIFRPQHRFQIVNRYI